MRVRCGFVLAVAVFRAVAWAEQPDPPEWRNALDLRKVVAFIGEGTQVYSRQLEPAGLDPRSFEPPKLLKGAKLAYPESARRELTQGIVVLECMLDAAGKVSACRIGRSLPPLDQAALDYVQLSKYAPAKIGGEPRAIVVSFSVMFRLY